MLFHAIHDIAPMIDRERVGRESGPSAGIADSQAVTAPTAGATRGTTPPKGRSAASGIC